MKVSRRALCAQFSVVIAIAGLVAAPGCGGGNDTSSPTNVGRRISRAYRETGRLGLQGLTYDVAVVGSRVYTHYFVPGSGTSQLRADAGNADQVNLNTPPASAANYPSGTPGAPLAPRHPFSLAAGPDGSVYAGVLVTDGTSNTVQKFDSNLSPVGGWDPLAANPGLSFNFVAPQGSPLITVGTDENATLVANPDYVPPKYSVATDASGNVYVLDAVNPGGAGNAYRIRRFRGDNAALDTGFGSGGTLSAPGFGKLNIDADGDMYLAYTDVAVAPGGSRAGVWRIRANGELDTAFSQAVAAMNLGSTSTFDLVADVAVVNSGANRDIAVLEYTRTGGLKKSTVHVLNASGAEQFRFDLSDGAGNGLDARDIAFDGDGNLYANVAFGTYYADSGGWGFFRAQ